MMQVDKARMIKSISIVAPFFNEAESVRQFHTVLTQVMDTTQVPYELVYVDDGSQDQTSTILNVIADHNPNVNVITLSRNFGHQEALTAGLDFASGQVIISMDSDLQHPPSVIPEMLRAYIDGNDIVYTVRRDAENLSFSKRITATLFYHTMKTLANVDILPGSADFRLMSYDVVKILRQMREQHRYLRGMIPWLGFKSAIIKYDQPDRYAGIPVYTLKKSLHLALNGLFSFSTIPLQIITWIGMFMTLLALIYLIYIFLFVVNGKTVEGWTSTIVVVLIIGGIQLTSIGIIAQYIGRIFEQTKNRPIYVIQQQRISKTREIGDGVFNG